MEGVKEISNITEIRSIKQVWMEQPDSFPVFLEENQELFPRIGERQKKENQALAEEFSKRMQKKVRQRRTTGAVGKRTGKGNGGGSSGISGQGEDCLSGKADEPGSAGGF